MSDEQKQKVWLKDVAECVWHDGVVQDETSQRAETGAINASWDCSKNTFGIFRFERTDLSAACGSLETRAAQYADMAANGK